MNLKKTVIVCLCAIFALGLSAAPQKKGQGGPGADVKREAMDYKLRYLSKRMELTPEQSERFGEIYRRMSAEKERIFKEMYAAEKKVHQNKDATEKDYQTLNEQLDRLRKQDADLEERYDKEFKTFLSAKQLYDMKKGEHDFMRRLREMYSRKSDGSGKKKRHSQSPGLPDAEECSDSCPPSLNQSNN